MSHIVSSERTSRLPACYYYYYYYYYYYSSTSWTATLKYRLTVYAGTPSHSYGVSLAMWDHTVLPATRLRGSYGLRGNVSYGLWALNQ